MAGAFDGAGEFALETCGNAGDARRQNFAARGEEALEELDILVIDGQRDIGFEGASFTFCATETTASCCWG